MHGPNSRARDVGISPRMALWRTAEAEATHTRNPEVPAVSWAWACTNMESCFIHVIEGERRPACWRFCHQSVQVRQEQSDHMYVISCVQWWHPNAFSTCLYFTIKCTLDLLSAVQCSCCCIQSLSRFIMINLQDQVYSQDGIPVNWEQLHMDRSNYVIQTSEKVLKHPCLWHRYPWLRQNNHHLSTLSNALCSVPVSIQTHAPGIRCQCPVIITPVG